MKIQKLTSEDGEVKFEILKEIVYFGGDSHDSYITTLSAEDVKLLKAALNARNDI